MRVAITGGTGFVGKALTRALLNRGDEVLILTRNPPKSSGHERITYIEWLTEDANPAEELNEVDFIVNLAGESINSGRWTKERKQTILNSRIQSTEETLSIIRKLENKPKALINASAVGFYGTSLSKTFTETTKVAGCDFLAYTVKLWEVKALEASELGVRTVLCRFGIILDKEAGALPRIALPYTIFAGGTVGSGKQWVSWIHLDDVVEGMIFSMENEGIEGPVNFTAPSPVSMKEFGMTLGSVLHRPHWFPAPGFLLKALLGEMSLLVLEGQKVLPDKLLRADYPFRFREVEKALGDIYRK